MKRRALTDTLCALAFLSVIILAVYLGGLLGYLLTGV